MILVTGGTGYIGSHTVVELQNEGFDIAIIDNLSSSNIRVLEGIEAISGKKPLFEKFDICEFSLLNNFFKKNRIDAVIHFAAYKAVGESVSNPLMYYQNNLVSLMNLLHAMKENNVPALVFSSSCTVYGEPDSLPVTEEAPIKLATSPYGNTKQICEEIIQDTIKAHPKMKSVALRYFNPIGAHESALIGELPIGVPNNLVPFITQTAFGLRDCLKVFGNDYDTPDGTCIRDYINVTDLAKAHIAALKRLIKSEKNSGFEVFNLGTGMGSSVLEVINSFEKVTGVRLNYIFADRRPGDVVKVYASTDKANKVLGWKVQKSLDETLLSAWNWENYYRKHIANKTDN